MTLEIIGKPTEKDKEELRKALDEAIGRIGDGLFIVADEGPDERRTPVSDKTPPSAD